MSIITLPAALRIGAGGGMGQARFDLLTQSEGSGTQQVRLLAPPRWTLRLVQPDNLLQADAATWQSLVLRLRGRVNVLAAWDVARPAPLGSARGTLVTSGTTAAGATSVVITGATHQNLLRYTQVFDNAVWVKTSSTVVSNATTAPDGTATADEVVEAAATAGHYVSQPSSFVAGTVYTASAYVKAASGSRHPQLVLVSTAFGTTAVASLNLATGVVTRTNGTAASAVAVGSGWYRLRLTATATATVSASLQIRLSDTGAAAVPYLGDGASGVYVWGAQVEAAGAATDYAAGATLLAGDWLQIGTGLGTSHYCMVTAAATADDAGALTVSFEPPTRAAFSAATAVTWDRPLAYYRQQTESTTWTLGNGGRSGVLVSGLSLDLMEVWS